MCSYIGSDVTHILCVYTSVLLHTVQIIIIISFLDHDNHLLVAPAPVLPLPAVSSLHSSPRDLLKMRI